MSKGADRYNLAFSGMENCADMDTYQNWAWNDLNCETYQANVTLMAFTVELIPNIRLGCFCHVWFICFAGFCVRGGCRCDQPSHNSCAHPTNPGALPWGRRYMGRIWKAGHRM